jgi:peptidoglycan hydrolase-like protein with peptidoglycan-binding domain
MDQAVLLKVGASGQVVTTLQSQLKARGFDPGPVDGIFGPGTEQAVRRFQEAQGLLVDGVVGVDTSSALGLPAIAMPPATLVALGHAAEDLFGLGVGECSAPGAPASWGPVTPVHAPNSLHYQGRAFDAAGDDDAMRRFTSWVVENYGGTLAELIHNPNGSIKDGAAVDPGFWGDATWAAHANHVHLGV